jgi:hypothetical protein
MRKDKKEFYVVGIDGEPWALDYRAKTFKECERAIAWQQAPFQRPEARWAICIYLQRGLLQSANGDIYRIERGPYTALEFEKVKRALFNQNFLVSKAINGKFWEVLRQRRGVSATVWDRERGFPLFKTAKDACAYLAFVEPSLTPWIKTIGRGNATYRAQNYTGPIMNGLELDAGMYADEITYKE